MERFSRRGFFQRTAAVLALPKFAKAIEVSLQPETRPLYFPETGHHLSGDFQEFWRRHRNGLLLGIPISETTYDGDGRRFQYFENARLEENPENGVLQLGSLAQELLERTRVAIPLDTDIPPINEEFFRKHGGVDFFGRPLSDAQPSGEFDYAQYTQRFVIIKHPSVDIPERLQESYNWYLDGKLRRGYSKLLWPGEMEVSPLGRQTVETLGVDTTPVPRDPQAIAYSPTLRDSQKRIEVSISNQTLIAYEATLPVFTTLVSTGRDLFNTPLGNYSVLAKVEVMDYRSPFPQRINYLAPSVPFNLRVRWEGEFIHGTYWHDNFGRRTSVGCINLNIDDAHWIYEWARVRTPVSIRT